MNLSFFICSKLDKNIKQNYKKEKKFFYKFKETNFDEILKSALKPHIQNLKKL